MIEHEIVRLIDAPEWRDRLAEWFHQRWGIALAAYLDSMNACLDYRQPVPQWYAVLAQGKIVAGLGVIENDFHDRKDLRPNVCAVYVDKEYRNQGIAGEMLDHVCMDMKDRGIDTLYLVTDHSAFYERYGWEFLCMVQPEGESEMSRMYVHR